VVPFVKIGWVPKDEIGHPEFPLTVERRRSSLIFAILQGVEIFQWFFSVAIVLQPTFNSRNAPTTTRWVYVENFRCRLNSFLDIGVSTNAGDLEEPKGSLNAEKGWDDKTNALT
jgi:hypothetical protein